MISPSTTLSAAGEHYVMCQLLRRGLIAALAPAGVPHTDIILTDDIGDMMSAIQVKARVDKGSDGGWHMQRKHEDIQSDRLFYAFVDFGADLFSQTTAFIVPSRVVAMVIKRSHSTWLAQRGKRGQVRNDSNMRRFLPNYDLKGLNIGHGDGWLDQYKEAWKLIE